MTQSTLSRFDFAVDGLFSAANKHVVLEVYVLKAEKMSKHMDLSYFEKHHIAIARWQCHRVSAEAALVGCSQSEVVGTYQKRSKEGKPMNWLQVHGHGQQRLTDASRDRSLVCVFRSNSYRSLNC